MASKCPYENNKQVYWKLRRQGDLKIGEWVIIAEGELHLITPSRKEAICYLLETDITDVYFVQVGDEDRVYHV